MKQSAVGWIIDQLFELRNPTLNQIEIVKKAREMEKQQQDKFAIGFAEWVLSSGIYHQLIRTQKINKELLEIYKKEKGL
jgi:hypothetical protein